MFSLSLDIFLLFIEKILNFPWNKNLVTFYNGGINEISKGLSVKDLKAILTESFGNLENSMYFSLSTIGTSVTE